MPDIDVEIHSGDQTTAVIGVGMHAMSRECVFVEIHDEKWQRTAVIGPLL